MDKLLRTGINMNWKCFFGFHTPYQKLVQDGNEYMTMEHGSIVGSEVWHLPCWHDKLITYCGICEKTLGVSDLSDVCGCGKYKNIKEEQVW